jgi:hypothetical protein
MTANELAGGLDKIWDNECRSPIVSKSADMLRQQQAELNEAGHMICMLRWEIEQLQDRLNEFLVARDLAILRKASEK